MESKELTKVTMSNIVHEYHIEIAYSYQHQAHMKAKLKCLCTGPYQRGGCSKQWNRDHKWTRAQTNQHSKSIEILSNVENVKCSIGKRVPYTRRSYQV